MVRLIPQSAGFCQTVTNWMYQVHGIMDGELLEGDTREFATFAIH